MYSLVRSIRDVLWFPWRERVDLSFPYGVSRAVFVPAPVQTSVLVVTVATHPDDKPENSPRWCWRPGAAPPTCANGKPKQNRRGINMRTPWPIDSAHHTPSDLFITQNSFFARLRTLARMLKRHTALALLLKLRTMCGRSNRQSMGILRWKMIIFLRYSN